MKTLPDRFVLKGKNVLLTGATGYLGRSMARGLAEIGARVLINSRNQERVDILVKELKSLGLEAQGAAFNINNESEVYNWFEFLGNAPLHGLVNNAYSGGAGSIETAKSSEYEDSYEVSLVSTHYLLQCALPAMRAAVQQSGGASIVNIGSMYGMVSPDQRLYASKEAANPPFYGAAKAALLQWTRYAACEFGREGIRVNAISPGPFPSKIVQKSDPDFVSTLADKVPLGRIGQAEELQGPLAFLLSDASSYINGTNLVVDGGWTCW